MIAARLFVLVGVGICQPACWLACLLVGWLAASGRSSGRLARYSRPDWRDVCIFGFYSPKIWQDISTLYVFSPNYLYLSPFLMFFGEKTRKTLFYLQEFGESTLILLISRQTKSYLLYRSSLANQMLSPIPHFSPNQNFDWYC